MTLQPFFKKIVFLAFISSTVLNGRAQQQIIQTVTAQNRNCNAGCSVIDIPDLNNNPTAILFITPGLVNGANLNPHPIGAYYMYQNKWSVFNLDGTTIGLGAKFNVEYYTNPDPTKFVYVLPARVHFNDISYIDYAGLNNNPSAQIRVFPHVSPTMGHLWNKFDVKVEYDATVSKWFIANLNNTPIAPDVAYNVIYTNGTGTSNPSNTPGGNCNCTIPVTLPPNGSAGGDLGGTYPFPSVQKLQGKPISPDPPAVGQVLKWNGSAWEPANENAAGNNTYNAGTGLAIQGSTIYANNIAPLWNANQLSGHAVTNTTPATGQVLKWNGTAWEPGPDNTGTATATSPNSVQTFFSNAAEWSSALSNSEDYYFASHKYTITVAANSRLIISGNFFVQSGSCLGCQPAYSMISLYINTVLKGTLSESWTAAGAKQNESVNNYMIDVTPGTYIIQFKASHVRIDNSPPTTHLARSSSIMILPL